MRSGPRAARGGAGRGAGALAFQCGLRGFIMPAGNVTPASCAVLGRTRYALLPVEKEFGLRGIPYFKRVTALHENESDLADDCSMALGTSQQLKTAGSVMVRWSSARDIPVRVSCWTGRSEPVRLALRSMKLSGDHMTQQIGITRP